MVKTKLATKWVPNTVSEANALIRKQMDGDTQGTREDLAARLHSDRTLRRHKQLVGTALDVHLANRIGRPREREELMGWAAQLARVRPARSASTACVSR